MKKIILCLLRDGDVTRMGVALALLIGFSIMVASLYFLENQNLRIISASIGLALASFGGYAARAKTLRLKLFDSTYKNAKESYSKDTENS